MSKDANGATIGVNQQTDKAGRDQSPTSVVKCNLPPRYLVRKVTEYRLSPMTEGITGIDRYELLVWKHDKDGAHWTGWWVFAQLVTDYRTGWFHVETGEDLPFLVATAWAHANLPQPKGFFS